MNNLLKFAIVCIILLSFSMNSKAQIFLGGGPSLLIPDGDSQIGLNPRVTFGINESMEIASGVNYYLSDVYNLYDMNVDFHYVFGEDGTIRFYPLGGFNLMQYTVNETATAKLQFNVGGGTKIPINVNTGLFGEAKYIVGDFDGISLTAGILFKIGG